MDTMFTTSPALTCTLRFAPMTPLLAVAVAALIFASTTLGSEPLRPPARGLISSQPATTWEEGLLAGNGVIGANMFAQPLDETIIFTHERLFLPMGPPHVPPLQGHRLFEIRRLIDRGLYQQAEKLQAQLSEQDDFMYPDPFVPAFDLKLSMTGDDAAVEDRPARVEDYLRSVDFETGVARVAWTDDRGSFERRLFVSRADGIAALVITASKPGTIDGRLTLTPRQPSPKLGEKTVEQSRERFQSHVSNVKVTADGSFLTWRNDFTHAYPGSIQAMEGVVHLRAEGGAVRAEGESLKIEGADRVLALIALDPIYKAQHSRLEPTKRKLAGVKADFDALLTRHVNIHGEMFNRMRLDIGGGADHKLTTEELLAKSTMEQPSKALLEKQFDAGRYNIICCTGELPPNLQGVWAGTYVPNWASDFTQNGNVPSAIAAMLMGNTPELMLAYTTYLEELVPWMEINARHMFGARGIVLPSRTSTHGMNNAMNARFAGGAWVAGAAWASHFFYDYYLYTGDRKFLQNRALPFMQKTAVFFEDYLYEGPDGTWIFSPTQSPENWPGNSEAQMTFNATMDIAAAKELFTNLIAASQELEIHEEQIPKWHSILSKMPDYMIDEQTGTVKEWTTPKLTENLGHRHSSHMYALYDGITPEIENNPELQGGFKRIIEYKLEKHYNKSGFMSFGVVQLGQAAASLGEAELAYDCVRHLCNRFWLANLASMHNHRSLLNMDISGGQPAVMIKMLVYSEPGRIDLLPACPRAWDRGALEGALCRGQIELKRLAWKPGAIDVTLRSPRDQAVELRAPFEIDPATAKGIDAEAPRWKSRCRVSLPADTDVAVSLRSMGSKGPASKVAP